MRRWDVVAGGECADWSACLSLLEASSAGEMITTAKNNIRTPPPPRPTTTITAVDESLDDSSCNKGRLVDKCNDNGVGVKCRDGRCQTALWEDSFCLALASSIKTCLSSSSISDNNSGEVLRGR